MGILSALFSDLLTVYFKEVTDLELFEDLYESSALTLDDGFCKVEGQESFCRSLLSPLLFDIMDSPFKSQGCTVYYIKGATMNNFCHLTGANSYKDDHTIICFKDYKSENDFNAKIYANQHSNWDGWRWLDDIVDNNAHYEWYHPFIGDNRVSFNISDYRTTWGEEIFLVLGNERYKMEYTSEDLWSITLSYAQLFSGLGKSSSKSFHYEVWQDGCLKQSEDIHHTLYLRNPSLEELNNQERYFLSASDSETQNYWNSIEVGY